ncbi:hypothetical protein Cgig2_009276 [Carnegiea gigantea]|uniref:Transcription initiation factor IIE subunit alpha N-terminal domain-containing protein n=1 Tax=Carnegiea gigantea TaxID=171969 RepID=A0A9Q1K0N5_9CARY|nr:hypothetical protein Cgig2_009276 [Carnegiea gigantea]
MVKLTARAFYDDISTRGDNVPNNSRGYNRGMAVVILDALTRLMVLVCNDVVLVVIPLVTVLAIAKGVKIHAAAVAATVDSQHSTREGGETIKLRTHSYCCLDYAQVASCSMIFVLFNSGSFIIRSTLQAVGGAIIGKKYLYNSIVGQRLLKSDLTPPGGPFVIYDVMRYRMHHMKKKIKVELDSKNTIQQYICSKCSKRYTDLDAARLVSMEDEDFHCESCNGELVAESDKSAAQGLEDGDENARRHRREKLKEMLQKIEEQLKPLAEHLNRIKDLPPPEFGTLWAWEVRAAACGQAGTPMPFVGDTKVEVLLSGMQAKAEDAKSETTKAPMKVLPPWIIKQGMNLTKEQHGEVKVDGSSIPCGSDDKKSNIEKDAQSLLDDYLKAYAAAIEQQQQEAAKKQEELFNGQTSDQGPPSERQVGMKSKHEDEDEDDLEWEEARRYKINASDDLLEMVFRIMRCIPLATVAAQVQLVKTKLELVSTKLELRLGLSKVRLRRKLNFGYSNTLLLGA